MRAIAVEILDEALKKDEAQRQDRAGKAAAEQATKLKTAREAQDDHETALVVASNLSMLCLKRLEDCLNDLGDVERGYADMWLAGEVW